MLTLKDPRNAEFALWRNAGMRSEINFPCEARFGIWQRDVGLPYFTLCAQHLSFLFPSCELNIILEGELSPGLELN